MLYKVFHHFKIVFEYSIVKRHHVLFIFSIISVLLKVLMREPHRILQKQVFKNLLVAVHGRDMTCVLSLFIRCGEFQILTSHEHLYHDNAITIVDKKITR